MPYKEIKNYKIYGSFKVTYNPKERTHTIYTKNNICLGTVDDGEFYSELNRLEEEFGD